MIIVCCLIPKVERLSQRDYSRGQRYNNSGCLKRFKDTTEKAFRWFFLVIFGTKNILPMNKISHITTNNLLYVGFKNHNQCFYSTLTQSLKVLIPHHVTKPLQINTEKGNGFVMKATLINRLNISGLGQLVLYM